MKDKSKLSIKIISVVLTGVIGICCFTTACQPVAAAAENTPDIIEIIGAQTEELPTEDFAPETASPEETAAAESTIPARFETQFEDGFLKDAVSGLGKLSHSIGLK